jgi:RNA polymerase sigma factor (sigma-70 family)
MVSTEEDDDLLMRAWVQGDARAFDRLYQRHHAALYRFVRRVLGAALAQQVDEVFQDTWSRVIQARERWAPQGATFRTWLFTLAHHRAIDCLRKSGREVSVDDGPAADDGPGGDPWAEWPSADASEPADQAFWRAAGERLLQCLDGLPAAQRSVFLLHHEDGLTLDELARLLDLGFETAKSRLRYAMNKLRTCMGAYLPAAGGLT